MDEHHAARNILLYRIYVLFGEPLFWGAVLITSLQQLAHMSLPDIYFMESGVLLICVALNVPAGMLADRIGRKRTVIAGRTLLLASAVCFAFMQSPRDGWQHHLGSRHLPVRRCGYGAFLRLIACSRTRR
jgi:MFS family permease